VRALVTGCAGFIGSHLTESLLTDGHEVIGVDCFNGNYARPQKLRNLEGAQSWESFEFVPVDLARGDLDDLVEGCDTVFHLAAEPGVPNSWGRHFEKYVRNNVVATEHLLEATEGRPGTRFVYASSSSIYGQAEQMPTKEDTRPAPCSPYGVTKLAGEHLTRAYQANLGVDSVCLRYFSVYGPRQRPDMAFNIFCHSLLEDRPIELFGGDQTRDFTFVADVVAATRAAATTTDLVSRVYNVAGGSRTSLKAVLNLLVQFSGASPTVRRTETRPGDVRDTGADISLAEKELGYVPNVTIEEGLRAEWEWFAAALEGASSP
jgi:UDP-glucuronate 4-epimerase